MPKNTRTVTVTEFEVQGDHQNDKINNITFSKTCMIFNKSCKFFFFSQTSPDVKMKNSANTAGTVTESEVQGDILSEDDQINNDKSSKARQQKTRQIVSAAAAAENSDENESTLVMEEEENSESDETVVEKPTEPDSAKLQKKLGPEILNLENSSNKHAKVVGAKTSNNSEKQQSSGSINIEGKVQNPTEGVSGKFSPKSRQIAAETAEIEKQQQNNASWEDLVEEEVEEANEPEPVIKFKKHVPVKKPVKSTPAKSPPKKLSKAARFAQRNQNKLRAISTPNKNESMLQDNVTFMDRSADISSIPVLSPPKSRKARKPVNEASFQ